MFVHFFYVILYKSVNISLGVCYYINVLEAEAQNKKKGGNTNVSSNDSNVSQQLSADYINDSSTKNSKRRLTKTVQG